MKRYLFYLSVLFFSGFIAVQLTLTYSLAGDSGTAGESVSESDNGQAEPAPEPAEGFNLNSSKSNVNRKKEPSDPEAVEETTVKSSKSNSSE